MFSSKVVKYTLKILMHIVSKNIKAYKVSYEIHYKNQELHYTD